MTLKEEIAAYEEYIGRRVGWLEKLGDALTGLDERQDYTNRLLMRMLLALGVPAPPAPPEIIVHAPPGEVPQVIIQQIAVPLGRPISKLDRVTTTSQTYVDVIEWEIPARHSGELFEVSMASDNFTKTQFRLVLANEEQWTDKYLISALTQPFRGNRLAELMKVVIQAQSSDGTEITAYGAIAGKLIQP